MSSISSDFKPYVARFTGYVGDDYREDAEGRVIGIWNHAGMPHYLVETATPDGVRRVGIADAVTYLRPAHDFTAVKHNLPEGSVVRRITSCEIGGEGNSSDYINICFDDSHLTARVMGTDRARLDELGAGGFQDTEDLIGVQLRVDVVDGKLSFRDFVRKPSVWRKAQ